MFGALFGTEGGTQPTVLERGKMFASLFAGLFRYWFKHPTIFIMGMYNVLVDQRTMRPVEGDAVAILGVLW
jgi:hypothetical protein